MPSTPYLTIDIDVLRRNLATMATWAAERGVALRPHVKRTRALRSLRCNWSSARWV